MHHICVISFNSSSAGIPNSVRPRFIFIRTLIIIGVVMPTFDVARRVRAGNTWLGTIRRVSNVFRVSLAVLRYNSVRCASANHFVCQLVRGQGKGRVYCARACCPFPGADTMCFELRIKSATTRRRRDLSRAAFFLKRTSGSLSLRGRPSRKPDIFRPPPPTSRERTLTGARCRRTTSSWKTAWLLLLFPPPPYQFSSVLELITRQVREQARELLK